MAHHSLRNIKIKDPYQKIPFSAMIINGDFFDFQHLTVENYEILYKEAMFKTISIINFII